MREIARGFLAYSLVPALQRRSRLGPLYLGIDISREYQVDQVAVSLRAVNVRTGQVAGDPADGKETVDKYLSQDQ